MRNKTNTLDLPIGVEVRQMWPNGPYRLCSDQKTSLTPDYHTKERHTGAYVCEECQETTVGVYAVPVTKEGARKWICSGCKKDQKAIAEVAA
jgi:predicted SprT family Zn-dependent metalloprotease